MGRKATARRRRSRLRDFRLGPRCGWRLAPSGAARYGPRVDHVRLPDPHLAVAGRRVACSTRLAYGGAYQLTIWTIVRELVSDAAGLAATVEVADETLELVDVA